jgi:hypothetical protein
VGEFDPYGVCNRREFLDGITALGYRVVDDRQNREQHCEIPFTRGRDVATSRLTAAFI